MYKIKVQTEIAGAHQLQLSYESPCEKLHGHNWLIEVTLACNELDDNGMVCDFKFAKKLLKEVVHDVLDHSFLNDILDFNPTAENISKWISEQINNAIPEYIGRDVKCVQVCVFETPNNVAIWEE